MNLKTELDKFAKKLGDKASKDATPLQESIDAFKALTAYYAAQQKNRKKPDDDESEDEGFSFASEGSNGGQHPKAPTRRAS